VQGANRLASNSVTEAIIAGRRTGAAVAGTLSSSGGYRGTQGHQPLATGAPSGATAFRFDVPQGKNGATGRAALAQAMSRCAGVMRDGDGLTRLLELIAETRGPCSLAVPGGSSSPGDLDRALDLDLESVEAANLRAVSLLIAVGARRRSESRGCHRRLDAADTAAAPWHTLVRWDGHKLLVTKETM
jgi:L-aspartate oxidase